MNLERYIRQITHDGKTLADFLVQTLQGNTHDATVSHRFKATEWLAKFGGFIPETEPPAPKRVNAKTADKPAKADEKPPVTEKQILHFHMARQIREDTQDGKTCIDFLARVVEKDEKPNSAENFTTPARMRATRELLNRGWGSVSYAGRRPRILSGDTEDLGSDLAKRIREFTEDGASIVRMLVDALENEDPKAIESGASAAKPKPQNNFYKAEGFTASQRVWVACELLRRSRDVKIDHITYHDIEAYWQSQTPVDKLVDDAYTDAPDISRQSVPREGAQVDVAAAVRAADAAIKRAKSSEQPAATAIAENPAAVNTTDGNANYGSAATAIAEKPAAANTTDGNANSANTPDGNAPTRAERRREQRAIRKAEKRSPRHSDEPVAALTPENQADVDAFIARRNGMGMGFSETAAPRKASNPANAAANTPDGNANSATPTRAERRREQRAARKAEKRANKTPAANSVTHANHAAVDSGADNPKPTTYFNSPEFEAKLWRNYHEAKARNAHTMATDPFYAESGIVLYDPLPPKEWKQWRKNIDYYQLTPAEFYEKHGEYPDPNNIPPPLDDP